ncbi:glycosyltransferase family 4 protein [Ktedonosporobacter rubrisoli]|uniref:Glycosyltransferase family 4 protein n=1 Tax=Ktedonosporobacter rubrisoli TaxID=2509675 RepID=A0A4P6JNC6_KTERU|nr:glycosyltransferase family 4 protein [Ktedonosporobacter rubrisoli]QBD76809.1 glycosyltransferase family 4 protein [Ktedonosporobacter rubrisoli]
MRYALVAPLVAPLREPHIGGSQAQFADLAQALCARGHEVTLFAHHDSEVPGVDLERINVPASVQPTLFSGEQQDEAVGKLTQTRLFFECFLRLQQRRKEFDLVHIQSFDWPVFAFSQFLSDVPVMHTLQIAAIDPDINQVLHLLHQHGHPLTLVTVSQACARTFAEFTSIDEVIYNGVNCQSIPFMKEVPSDAPLLFAGRLAPEKGVEEAIKIALQAGRPLLLAGGIYDQCYFQQIIRPLLRQHSRQLTYLGQLDRPSLWKLMGQARGLLFPIQWEEAFGLVPVEAMAAGTPVIAFRRGAVEETILQGVTGFLVEPGDCMQAAALVEKLSSLRRTDCRQHVESRFSLVRMVDCYEQLYERLRMQRGEYEREGSGV